MEFMIISKQQADRLVAWFDKNKRILPWRDTGNPYDVWLSEIMLQQTRVEFVKERFIAFKRELPDIRTLAGADDDRLMKLWEGMGYYSRARNLKKCAVVLCEKYDAKLPSDISSLEKLPGIGPYTAGAIASIAYGRPVPAVDGNVLRVLTRLSADERDIRLSSVKTDMEKRIQDYFDHSSKRDDPVFVSSFNQGLMELGALVCVPNGAPHCRECPWYSSCLARKNDLTAAIPFRSPLPLRKIEQRTILVLRDGERFVLHKRSARGLLAGLYEFIGINGFLNKTQAAKAAEKLGFSPVRIQALPESKHVFSHVEWHMRAYEIMVENVAVSPSDDLLLVTKKELQQFAVPSAFHAYKAYYALDR